MDGWRGRQRGERLFDVCIHHVERTALIISRARRASIAVELMTRFILRRRSLSRRRQPTQPGNRECTAFSRFLGNTQLLSVILNKCWASTTEAEKRTFRGSDRQAY
jgi:hypothetical protein